MKERVVFQDMNALWAEHVAASTSPRMKDDGEEQAFWRRFMARKAGYAPDPASRPVAKALTELAERYGVESVLEWGPGWGNYTIDLAKSCRRVDCVDISRDVLDFILRVGGEQGCRNIAVHQGKWEEYEPEGLCDMVFGYNCFYRQADLRACFQRMERCAGKLCVAGMNSGLAPQWIHDLAAAGYPIKWEWKDYIYFVNVLYQMGVDANVMILPFVKETVYPDAAAMVSGECARMETEPDNTGEILDILLQSFQRQEDGSYRAEAAYHSALVYWTPGCGNASMKRV